MYGFSILMLIFSLTLLLFGLYIFTGHDVSSLFWRAQYKNLTKKEWKNIGKWTMIFSIIPFILAIIGLLISLTE